MLVYLLLGGVPTAGCCRATDLKAVEAVAEPWQARSIRPLRALRRRLKGGFGAMPADRVEAYRKGFSELEIEGEHIAQNAMAVAAPRAPRPAPAPPPRSRPTSRPI